jgi:hypothetical protein
MTRARAERIAWLIGAVGIIGAAIGWALRPQNFPHSWLAALAAWIGWPLGSMALILIHALTGGRWGDAIRPALVAGMTTLWLLVPALIPLALVRSSLYPWLQPELAMQLNNTFYLNAPFLLARTVIYVVVWYGLAWLVLRALRSADPPAAVARLAPPGLILLALTGTYASIDATMSLDPHFSSSDYGLIATSEMGLLALAVAVLGTTFVPGLDRDSRRDLGQLLLGLVILWAYLDFMQVLIVWQSDLPDEAAWYVARTSGGWGIVAAFVAVVHFLFPFLALLSPRVQRSRPGLGVVAALLVLGTIVHNWWLVLPAAGRGLGVLDLFAMLGLPGLAAATALRWTGFSETEWVVRNA